MDTSIHYTATRFRPLTPAEREAIAAAIARYPLSALIAECGLAESEYDGEAFRVCQPKHCSAPWIVFEGATRLPLRSEAAMWVAVRYWSRLLAEVEQALPDASWEVYVTRDEEPAPPQDQSRLLKAAALERRN